MHAAVIVFPGSNCDRDLAVAFKAVGAKVSMVWHKDTSLPEGVDIVGVPGGFSYGDYLRCGAIAANSPICREVAAHAERGGYVMGICNGFQILCEAGLLPGALLRNQHLEYRCQWSHLRTERADTPFSLRCQPGQLLRVPVSHGDGNYFADPETLAALEEEGRVLFRYSDLSGIATEEANPNGAAHNIAGIINQAGNILGMMPHPERSCEALLGSTDGNLIFQSIIDSCGVK